MQARFVSILKSFSLIELQGKKEDYLSPSIISHLFRIVQEALNNTLKHSEAKQIKIVLKAMGNMLSLNIADNGKGIDKLVEKQDHYGLKNMRDRVKELNGEIDLKNQDGLSIEIRIPLK